jgi:hypothetical protein
MSFSLASFERRFVAGLEADAAAVCLRLGGYILLVDVCLRHGSCDDLRGLRTIMDVW